MLKQIYFIMLLLINFPCFIYCQTNNTNATAIIKERFAKQLAIFPQEKIHLHLDKPHYITGEKIWLRAFPVNAISNQPYTDSRYVYVELIDPADSIVERVRIRPDSTGIHQGYLPIRMDLPSGIYSVRAYTRMMESIGDEYFFRKRIELTNPSDIYKNEVKIWLPEKDPDYEVSFFPEGGNWPQDINWRIAFRSTNTSGWSENIQGYIINEKEDTITSIRSAHNGMGIFSIIATPGSTYYAVCENEAGITKRFKLPEASFEKPSLKAAQINDKLIVSVEGLSPARLSRDSLTLLLHTRGIIHTIQPWESGKKELVFSRKELPAGILQIVLLDKELQPISERLLFCPEENGVKIAPVAGFQKYTSKEKVSLKLRATDKQGIPIAGNFSVAITCDNDVQPDTSVTISSSLLINTELKGFLEVPTYSLLKNNRQTTILADLFMMTQHWNRYNIGDILAEKYSYPAVSPEIMGTLKGQVIETEPAKKRKNEDILMTFTTDDNQSGFAYASEEGHFIFNNFEFPDSSIFTIRMVRPETTPDKVNITVAPFTPPALTPLPSYTPDTTPVNATNINYITKAYHQQKHEGDMRNILLDNVDINAKAKTKPGPQLNDAFYTRFTDLKYTYEDIAKYPYKDAVSIIQQIPEVRIIQERSTEEVPIFMNRKVKMCIIIDDIQMPDDYNIRNLNIREIESISIMPKGTAGTRWLYPSGSPAIVVTTKRQGIISAPKNYPSIEIMPLGFQQPIKFTMPDYNKQETTNEIKPDLRTTLYWNPYVSLDENGEGNFSFYTAAQPGSYSIIIEGISNEGHPIYLKEQLIVE